MADRPNIIFIMSDDHASHAMSCYGSRINKTPHIDRIADGGIRLDNCFCTNSICTPSRATILTGTYNHVNDVRTLSDHMDNRLQTFPKLLQGAGYQTGMFGKWHLGQGPEHEPTGFDRWCVLPGQGAYHDPEVIEMGERKTLTGYTTDLITDMCLDWMSDRDPDRPFMLMCHHKAPHRPWEPDEKHIDMYADEDIPEPETLFDDFATRAAAAEAAEMRVDRDMTLTDLKEPKPDGLDGDDLRRWCYQRYIKDYLRCVASIDDNVGRMLDYLDEQGLADDTLIVYTSDQGFFLGDHGWYDKRFMYEESLRMPMVIRYPRAIPAGTTSDALTLNVDFAQTFLDYAGVDDPGDMQGRSARPVIEGEPPDDWRDSMYYRYWMHQAHHNVYAHYGLRTHRYKLIYYYADPLDQAVENWGPPPAHDTAGAKEPEWELFDLEKDPHELNNVYHDPEYQDVATDLRRRLRDEQLAVDDEPWPGEAP